MRPFLLFCLISIALIHTDDVRAGDCMSSEFGQEKIDVTPAKEIPKHLMGMKLPERGLIMDLEGFFINEGLSDQFVLDIDTGSLSHVVYISESRNASIKYYRGYQRIEGGADWQRLRRTVTLSRNSLDSVICKANYIWRYESPSARFDRETKLFDIQIKAWEKAFAKCKRSENCLPDPVPDPPLLALDESGELFSRASDVGEYLLLVDHKSRKYVGGLGALSGEAASLRSLLFDLIKAEAD